MSTTVHNVNRNLKEVTQTVKVVWRVRYQQSIVGSIGEMWARCGRPEGLMDSESADDQKWWICNFCHASNKMNYQSTRQCASSQKEAGRWVVEFHEEDGGWRWEKLDMEAGSYPSTLTKKWYFCINTVGFWCILSRILMLQTLLIKCAYK